MSAISAFTGAMSMGGSRANRFEIVGSAGTQYFAKASSLPASTIGKCEAPYMGRIVNFAGDRTFDDWNVTIYNEVGHAVRKAIIAWMEIMNQHEANTGSDAVSAYYNETWEVKQMLRSGGTDYSVFMANLFPISCGEVTLGWDQNDQVEEFEVTFAINYWKL